MKNKIKKRARKGHDFWQK